MELFGKTKQKITKKKDGENVPHLGTTETILVFCNAVNNQYLRDSWVLYTFIPNKNLMLLYISPTKHFHVDKFCSEFSYVEVWSADQNSVPLEIEDRTNLT